MNTKESIYVPNSNTELKISHTTYPPKFHKTHLSWWVSMKMRIQEIKLSNGMDPRFAMNSIQFTMQYLNMDAKISEKKLNYDQ